MRSRHLLAGAALLLVLSLAHAGDPPTADKARIGRLVTQLGNDSFREREQARKELEAIGAPALDALRRAAHTGDLETSRRAADLVRVIEEHTLTAALLAPRRVHLKLKEVPVLQAVAQLARQSGYTVRVDGDRTVLAGKTVTLDTGDVAFWEAVDRLGAAAGLVEKLAIASIPGDPVLDNEIWYDVGAPVMVNRRAMLMKAAGRNVVPPPPPLRIMPLLPPQPAPPAEKNTRAPVVYPSARGDAKGNAPAIMPGRVILAPGKAGQQHASYAGAVRVLLKHPRGRAAANKGYDLVLETSAEPRLLGFTLAGVPTVTRAVDEHGQVLSFIIDPTPAAAPATPASPLQPLDVADTPARPSQRGVTIRLQAGAKPAQRLRELSGSLSAQVFLPKTTLMVLDNVLTAKGKFADIKGGGRLQLEAIEKTVGGNSGPAEYRVVCKLDSLANHTPVLRNGRIVNVSSGPLGADTIPELRDAKGQRLTLVNGPQQSGSTPDANGQVTSISLTMQFRCEAGQGEPARLVLIGTDVPTIRVPFRFENVPLR